MTSTPVRRLQSAPPAGHARIAALAEQIDAHRKRRQAPQPDLTLIDAYNLLERLRRIQNVDGEPPLTAKGRRVHDELDAAVLAAYGWSDLAPALVGRPGGTTPWPDKRPPGR